MNDLRGNGLMMMIELVLHSHHVMEARRRSTQLTRRRNDGGGPRGGGGGRVRGQVGWPRPQSALGRGVVPQTVASVGPLWVLMVCVARGVLRHAVKGAAEAGRGHGRGRGGRHLHGRGTERRPRPRGGGGRLQVLEEMAWNDGEEARALPPQTAKAVHMSGRARAEGRRVDFREFEVGSPDRGGVTTAAVRVRLGVLDRSGGGD